MANINHQQRQGAVLPLVAFLLTALLVIVAIAINSNWLLYHQINTQHATDLAARSSLVKILGDPESDGRIDRARAMARRIYTLSLDRADAELESDRIRFGGVQNPNATEPVFIENITSEQAVTAVTIDRPQNLDDQQIGLFFSGVIDRDSVGIVADAVVSTRPVDVMLCLDASRSMNRRPDGTFPPMATSINEPPLPESRWFELVATVDLLLDAMEQINPNARVGLVTFGGGYEPVRPVENVIGSLGLLSCLLYTSPSPRDRG